MQRWDTQRNDQRCLCCGGHVTPEFRRGYGDRDDRAHRRPDCNTIRQLAKGDTAGKEVVDVEPLEQPGRFGVPIDELPSNVRSLVESRAVAIDGGETVSDLCKRIERL